MVALVALIVIGGATRVMEAGLACPDWPLCYGSFFPGGKMNMQVFLEWFHRLDAFLVGIALLIQFFLGLRFKTQLPNWLLWCYGLTVLLVISQGLLGALTVSQLLPSYIVTFHLILALTLLSLMSGVTQSLLTPDDTKPPLWWTIFCGISLLAVIAQSLTGAIMATSWGAQLCLYQGKSCQLLNLHWLVAIPVSSMIIIFIASSLLAGGWTRTQWPFLLGIFVLILLQISVGLLTIGSHLNEPLLRVGHQLIAALLVALFAGLSVRKPIHVSEISLQRKDSFLEVCHG